MYNKNQKKKKRKEEKDVFFFNDTATTEIYTLSLHDALPISNSSLRLKISLTVKFRIRNIRDSNPVQNLPMLPQHEKNKNRRRKTQKIKRTVDIPDLNQSGKIKKLQIPKSFPAESSPRVNPNAPSVVEPELVAVDNLGSITMRSRGTVNHDPLHSTALLYEFID